MPALPNAKRELFAQAVANGDDLVEAHGKAGYKKNRGNASLLWRDNAIKIRVQELLEARAGSVIQKTTAEIAYTREKLLGYLEDARKMSIEKENPTALTGATVAMARILGLIIDRREVGEAGAFDGMTDDELMKMAEEKARELGIGGAPRLVVNNDDKGAA